eukprot:TRINITY_DN822_c0_g1_i2.p1 TRINITY_DN822_c0_g1~~TRINITY_DN822_c0_g1_i2.p1  ORF type:complete len:271 (-),score=7.33 TRINITY_DN822_c0_g1_i2:553-1365(-)
MGMPGRQQGRLFLRLRVQVEFKVYQWPPTHSLQSPQTPQTTSPSITQLLEANALMSFKKKMGFRGDELDWQGVNACNWKEIYCTNTEVTNITFKLTRFRRGDEISTSIPEEWSVMDKLREISIGQLGLTGTLPPQYSILSRLETFNFSSNAIEGTLPVEYSTLTNLAEFYCQKNRVTGMLPLQYSKFVNLEELWIQSNDFTGMLPPQYTEFKSLNLFDARQNILTGSVPVEYSVFGSDTISMFPQRGDNLCLHQQFKNISRDLERITDYC